MQILLRCEIEAACVDSTETDGSAAKSSETLDEVST